MNKVKTYICLALSIGLLAGCASHRRATNGGTKDSDTTVQAEKQWHTCLIQGARVRINTGEEELAANMTMQVVRDSMLVISVMPLLGIEMMRIEATPLEVIGIDKMHGRYAKAGYNELNRQLLPSLNWDILQQICSAELPTGSDVGRLRYSYGDKQIEISITYPARQTDVAVRVNSMHLEKYQEIDISKWL